MNPEWASGQKEQGIGAPYLLRSSAWGTIGQPHMLGDKLPLSVSNMESRVAAAKVP